MSMPNIVTHALITSEAFPGASTDLVLGSTLPDFIGMNKDYLKGTFSANDARKSPELAGGIAIHLSTDAIFDGLAARKQLLDDGQADCAIHMPELGSNTARRLANIGTGVLLDVVVIESPEGQEVYRKIKAAVLAGETAISGMGDSGFETLVRNYFEQDRVLRYSDTAWLAEMLRHRSSMRNRHILNFDDDLLPNMSAMFSRQLNRIRKVADGLLSLTVEGLKSNG